MVFFRHMRPTHFLTVIAVAITLGSGVFAWMVWEDERDIDIKSTFSVIRPPADRKTLEDELVPSYSSGMEPAEFFDRAYEQADELPHVPARSVLVAHHLLVAPRIAELFESIGDDQPQTVVILSPNHFSIGGSSALLSRGTWNTPYGPVSTDTDAVDLLLKATAGLDLPPTEHIRHDVRVDERAFPGEHGIGSITPFVARSFPNAHIVPIVLHDSFPLEGQQALAAAIVSSIPDAIVVASMDMSHNLPLYAASFHDEITQAALERGRCDGTCSLEIDANAVMSVLFEVNRLRGEQTWMEMYHGSSLDLLGTTDVNSSAWRENTSHIIGRFTEGPAEGESLASMIFVGDVMLDRDIRLMIGRDGVDAPWREMDRFLSGTNLAVGNLEGVLSDRSSKMTYDPPFELVMSPEAVIEASSHLDLVSLANNHTRDLGSSGETEMQNQLDEIGFLWFGSWRTPLPVHHGEIDGLSYSIIGYHAFAPNELELLDVIASEKRDGRLVIVMPHWGNEYALTHSAAQHALAQKMIRVGADLIVGSHPHMVQDIELVDGVPVVYSLGNFIFDQYNVEGWNQLAIGVMTDGENLSLRLLPTYGRGGRPTPISDTAATAIFKSIAERSDPQLTAQLRSGRLDSVIRSY